ncbi:hypothetical protein D9M71_33700 [compost metagenome]
MQKPNNDVEAPDLRTKRGRQPHIVADKWKVVTGCIVLTLLLLALWVGAFIMLINSGSKGRDNCNSATASEHQEVKSAEAN